MLLCCRDQWISGSMKWITKLDGRGSQDSSL